MSRSAQIMFAAGCIGAISFLANVLWDKHVRKERKKRKETWTHTTIRMLLETIMAVSIVSIAFETNLVRDLIRNEFRELLAYEKNLSDPLFLIDKFSEESIRKFREATNRALLNEELFKDKDNRLDSSVYTVLEGPVYKKVVIVRDQRIKKTKDGIPYYYVIEDVEAKISASHKNREIVVPIKKHLGKIPGLICRDQFRLVYLKIGDSAIDPLPEVNYSETQNTGMFEISCKLDASKDTAVHWKTYFSEPIDSHWVGSLKYLAKELIISIHYNEDELEPTLTLFGLGAEAVDSIVPAEVATGNRRWEYRGWIYKNHGWVVFMNSKASKYRSMAKEDY